MTVPVGQEAKAKIFYCDILGFAEIEKPDSLKPNGGFWLETGNLPLHIGVEDGVDRWLTKRHPAFETADLDIVRAHLVEQGVDIRNATPIPGYDRFYVYDPYGNRIELMQPHKV